MRISDWSSDVCSSDLDGAAEGAELLVGESVVHQPHALADAREADRAAGPEPFDVEPCVVAEPDHHRALGPDRLPGAGLERGDLAVARDRKRVVEGKRGSGRVDLGGGRRNKKKKQN